MKKIYFTLIVLALLNTLAKSQQAKAYSYPSVILTEEIIAQRVEESRKQGIQEWELENLEKGLTRLMNSQRHNLNNSVDNINQKNTNPNSPLAGCVGCGNIGFESGALTDWTLTSGNINSVALPCNTCASGAGGIANVVNSGSSVGTVCSAGLDNCSGLSVVPPGGGNNAVLLNNNTSGGKMQELQYKVNITAANNVLTYQYLVILQDGGSSHTTSQQPYFMSQVLDGSGTKIPCTYVFQTGGPSATGWTNTASCGGIYKGWNTVTLDMTSYIGQCVTLQFLVSDCNQGGHYGYCYIDANCDQLVANNAVTVCPPSAQLCGPTGFSTYSWTGPVTGNAMCLSGATAGAYTLVTTGQCPAPTRFYTVTVSPTPTVNFSSSVTPCNLTVPFTDLSTVSGGATITGWAWNFGDAGTSTAQNPSHTYATNGTFNVVLTCTSSVGCVASFTAPVTLGPGPTSVFTANTVCPGATTSFTNTSTGGVGGYDWDFGDGNNSTATNPTNTYSASGTYVVTLTVTGTGTCVATSTLNVTVSPLPTVTATGNTICNGAGPVNITGGGATTYTWDSGSTANPQSVNPAVTTNYTVTGTDANGCVNTATTIVNVIANPTITVANTSICPGSTATLTANSDAVTFAWTGPNLVTTTGTVVTANPAATSTYTVVGTAGTCTVSTTAVVTVNANIIPTFNAPPVCEGQATIFTNTTAGVSTYTWTFGDGGSTSVIPNPTNTYSAAGSYVATFSVVNSSGCTGIASNTVTVNPNPTVTATGSSICNGAGPVNVTGSGAATYTWDSGSTANPQSVNPAVTTNYTVIGSTAAGCTDTATTTVIVTANPTVTVANTSICAGATATLTANSNATTFTWTGSNIVAPATGSVITANPAAQSVYTVVGTTGSCTVSTTATVTINPNIIPTFTSPPVCQGQATIFTNTTAGVASYTWNYGDGNGSTTIPNPTETYSAAGSYVATFSVVNAAGCTGLATNTVIVNPTPVMNSMPDITVCDFQTVNVSAFGSFPAGSTFGWNNSNTAIGLGASGSGNIASFPGQTGGSPTAVIATVSVTPTLNGCVGPDSTFVITVSPQPTVTLTSPPFTCPGNVVLAPTYTMSPNDPSTTFAWTNNNINTGMAAAGNPTTPGSFTAASNATLANIIGVVTVTPTLGACVGPPATYTVTIYPTPVIINPNGFVEYCPNVSTAAVNISMLPVTGGVYSYNWIAPTGASIGLTPTTGTVNVIPSFTTINTGSTAVTSQIIVSGGLDGCPALPVTFDIIINPNPIASFAGSPKVCLGNPMSFTDASTVGTGSVTQWGWDFNNDAIYSDAVTQNPQFAFVLPGYHIVGLQVTTNKGCKSNTADSIYINYIPVPQFAGDILSGCPQHNVNFTENSNVTGPAQINNWAWSFGNGSTFVSQTANASPGTIIYNNSSAVNDALYSVSLQITTDSGCIASITNTNYITVYPQPVANFSWGPQDPDPDVMNPVVYFADLSAGAMGPSTDYGPLGIKWNLGDVFLMNQANNYTYVMNPMHTYEHYDPYIYNVTQWVENTHGCKDSITKPVEIKPNFTFYIPNAFSPNADGTNEGFKGTGVGIDNNTYNLWVFDRWGNVLFHANDIEKAWDGRFQGKHGEILQEDVYVWKVRFSDFKGRRHEYKGTVSLIK